MPGASPGWLQRLRAGLAGSSDRLSAGIAGIFGGGRPDADTLEALEELLISADFGVGAARALTARIADADLGREASADTVREALAAEIAGILGPLARPLEIAPAHRPFVIVAVGVNGTGKTATIGKLAHRFRGEGRSVTLAAGDTFRAAAIDQLKIWGERAGAPVIARAPGADPAGVAFEALEFAQRDATEVLLIDTAGRLHNKSELMAGLEKIVRVVKKLDATAPHACILVLDATTGQNAHAQVEVFRERCAVTGLVMTKLDGSAKGGVLVGIAERFAVPIHAIGVGEGIEDLHPFAAEPFSRALVGLG